jgi:hypothetical protein
MFEMPLWRRVLNRVLRANGTVPTKVAFDVYSRPHFAFGLSHAADQAARLGIKRMAAIEFGVAGGNGLVALEQISDEIGRFYGVEIDVFGFDAGGGMPAAEDYRDSPYIWQPGHFKLDEERLRTRLTRSQLLIGDIGNTLPQFISDPSIPPIGFVSIDTDYYSSAKKVLKLFDQPSARLLPRTFCYFDDIIGYDNEYHCEFVGELLAINEFNQAHETCKLAKINGLHYKRRFAAYWNDMIYVLHSFSHPQYSTFINPKGDLQRPLE